MGRFCVKQRPYFSDHLDGEKIPFWRGLLVRCHLATCPPCRRYNRALVEARGALADLRDADVDKAGE